MIIGWANGCFDGLHEGHKFFLDECRKHCDVLYVGIDTDARVRQLKGEGRPIHSLPERYHALMMYPPVMDARWFHTDEGLRALIEEIKPSVIFRGWDQKHEPWLAGYRLVSFPWLPGYSTTKLIQDGIDYRQ